MGFMGILLVLILIIVGLFTLPFGLIFWALAAIMVYTSRASKAERLVPAERVLSGRTQVKSSPGLEPQFSEAPGQPSEWYKRTLLSIPLWMWGALIATFLLLGVFANIQLSTIQPSQIPDTEFGGGGGVEPSPGVKVEQPTSVNINQREKAGWEIADEILSEQKARSVITQTKLKSLLESERYQEAKDLLIGRQKEIVAAMLEVRENEDLTDSDKKRVLEPMAGEAEGIANQVKIIVEFDIDELLRALE